MTVTISRAAERKRQPSPLRGAPGLLGEGGRRREAGLLALAGGVVLFAMVLAWLAVSRPLPDLQARLDRGEIVNLNAVSRPGDLLPLLDEERIGQVARARVARSGAVQEVAVTIGARGAGEERS